MIKTEHLTHKYGIGTPFESVAIEDVNLHIKKGDYVGVIGHTGSGKSTLISHFNAILKPTSGKIYIDGKDLWDVDKRARIQTRFDVGLVFQYPEYQLFEETVYKDIAFGPKNMGLSEEQIRARVEKSLEFVGLNRSVLEKSPFDLSGGQKRRVAIAGVMALEPKVLILDEPAAGLDPRGRDEILGRIKAYHQETKSTVLLVSHSMEDVSSNANSILVMNKGRCAMHDSVPAVFERADELVKMGLDVPKITRVFISLQEKGYPVSRNIYSVEQGKAELMRLLGKEGNSHA
ncbi:MAG: energy-coupling factor transporter ATPase [Clostridia bacterium]|nr:energy-coupling factor transporter ATPase [Clostridia bacterium]MBQ7090852.1 energy-coupling factor transporter ATPase [Clostridia bacterium]